MRSRLAASERSGKTNSSCGTGSTVDARAPGRIGEAGGEFIHVLTKELTLSMHEFIDNRFGNVIRVIARSELPVDFHPDVKLKVEELRQQIAFARSSSVMTSHRVEATIVPTSKPAGENRL